MSKEKIKVLVITYYWPPAGGPGVQRWLKTVKYFRDFDIEPIVYTVENPSYPVIDDTLSKDIPNDIEVIRQPIKEPNQFLNKFSKKKNKKSAGFLDQKPSLVGKVLQYIRANYFIPDARIFWVKPSVNFLSNYLKNNPVDAIVTTGPPHSVHLIGLGLKKKMTINWIADFRDPWMEIDYFYRLPLTQKSIKKHRTLEKNVLENADRVLVVGKTMQKNYLKIQPNTFVIPNGYDTSKDEEKSNFALDKFFSLTHIGPINADRNIKQLWEVLSEISSENLSFKNDLKLKFVGGILEEVLIELKQTNLKDSLEIIDYVPHSEVHKYQSSTQVLLLIVNQIPSAKGILTGKIFEYLRAKRPIFAIAPEDGDLAEIIQSTNSGYVIDYDNKAKMKQVLLEMYDSYKQNQLVCNSVKIEKYHRRELAGEIAGIIRNLV